MDRGIPTEATLAQMRQADPPVHYLVGTPKGRLSKLEGSVAQALARGPCRRAGQAAAAGWRDVRVRPERRSHRQGAGDAQTPAQEAVGTPAAVVMHDAHAPGVADEAGRRAQPVSIGLAA